jgi:putative MATE family efflux protein
MALPMILAQLINVLYNMVDRIFISRMPGEAFLALTGVGVCLPIISIVMAFANLFGMGGGPLCSIERGRGNYDEAEKIMGNSFVLLLLSGIILTVLGLLLKKPILYLFGASDLTFPFADQYVTIYLLGNVFVLISLGMNYFIGAQGFGKIGMLTVVLGAVTNIILDPIMIFLFKLGVQGAALATIISQGLSALWVLQFLTGKKAVLTLRWRNFLPEAKRVRRILGLGISGFVMQFTNSLVAMIFNTTLQQFGGDLYVGVMTIANTIREFLTMPVLGLGSGAQPVIGFNYGAGKHRRVKSCIKFTTFASMLFTTIPWLLIETLPWFFITIFNSDPQVLQAGIPMMRLFYLGFIFMAFQHAGQSTFVALGRSKHAIFFSTFRKVMLVIPLVLFLPRLWGLGSTGVFFAEPISEVVGGTACYTTMLLTVWRELNGDQTETKPKTNQNKNP